jgi:hypothetical protein
MCEEVVSSILSRHGIIKYKDLFSQPQYSKAHMPKSCDHLIRPYSIAGTELSYSGGTKIKTGSNII